MTATAARIRDVVIEELLYNDIKLKVRRQVWGLDELKQYVCGGVWGCVGVSTLTVLMSDKCLQLLLRQGHC